MAIGRSVCEGYTKSLLPYLESRLASIVYCDESSKRQIDARGHECWSDGQATDLSDTSCQKKAQSAMSLNLHVKRCPTEWISTIQDSANVACHFEDSRCHGSDHVAPCPVMDAHTQMKDAQYTEDSGICSVACKGWKVLNDCLFDAAGI